VRGPPTPPRVHHHVQGRLEHDHRGGAPPLVQPRLHRDAFVSLPARAASWLQGQAPWLPGHEHLLLVLTWTAPCAHLKVTNVTPPYAQVRAIVRASAELPKKPTLYLGEPDDWSWDGATAAAAVMPLPPPQHSVAAAIAACLVLQAEHHDEAIAIGRELLHLNPGLMIEEALYERSLSAIKC
jgi:hypothetical protein